MTSGNLNDLDIHPRIVSVAKKAGFTSSWKVLENSLGELRTKTGLCAVESERLMEAAAKQCSPPFTTGWQMHEGDVQSNSTHIKTGCCKIDNILGGGIPCRGVTEIAGESGSGKTQLALQVALQCQLLVDSGGLGKGVAYICTENQFPVSRLNQLIKLRAQQQIAFNGKEFSDNIYIHHLPDMDNLVDCIRYQLPQLIAQNGVGLVIIDSVAAAFRASEERQKVKSKMTQQLGFRLHQLANKYKVAVLAINQVTARIGDVQCMMEDDVIPALGLSWANLVTTRIMLRRTAFAVSSLPGHTGTQNINLNCATETNESKHTEPEMRIRILDVVFCPWLARKSCPFTVTEAGVKDVDPSSIMVLDQP